MGILGWQIWDRLDEIAENQPIERGQRHRYILAWMVAMLPAAMLANAIVSLFQGEPIIASIWLCGAVLLFSFWLIVDWLRDRKVDKPSR